MKEIRRCRTLVYKGSSSEQGKTRVLVHKDKLKIVSTQEMRQLQLEAAASLFFARIQPAYAQRGAHNPLDCKFLYKKTLLRVTHTIIVLNMFHRTSFVNCAASSIYRGF